MTRRNRGYDQKCEELAEHFLSDFEDATAGDAEDLAQELQETAESWLRDRFDLEEE